MGEREPPPGTGVGGGEGRRGAWSFGAREEGMVPKKDAIDKTWKGKKKGEIAVFAAGCAKGAGS